MDYWEESDERLRKSTIAVAPIETFYGIMDLEFSWDGKLLAAAGFTKQGVHLFDGETLDYKGGIHTDAKGAADVIRRVAFHPDGKTLVAFAESKVWLATGENFEEFRELPDIPGPELEKSVRKQAGGIQTIAMGFVPSGKYFVVSYHDDRRLWVYDTSTWTPVAGVAPDPPSEFDNGPSIEFSQGSDTVIAIEGRHIQEFRIGPEFKIVSSKPQKYFSFFGMSSGGERLLVRSEFDRRGYWDYHWIDRETVESLVSFPWDPIGAARAGKFEMVSPDGLWFFKGGEGEFFQIIDLSTGTYVEKAKWKGGCPEIAVTRDGKRLAALQGKSEVHLLRIPEAGKEWPR